MRGIRNWSVRTRLLIAFVGVLIPYLALAGIGAVGLQAVWQRVLAIHDEVAMEFVGIANLQLAVAQLVMPANDYLITGDPAERELFEQRFARLNDSLARAETIVFHDQEERRLFEAVRGQVPQIEALSREILAIPDPRVNRAAPAKMKALDQVSDEAAATLGRIREISLREIEENIERSSAVIRWVAAAGVAALLLSVAGGVGLGLIFSTWLSRPILAIAQTSRQMAEGDLSQRVETHAGGELGEAASAFNAMAERLEHSAIERARLHLDLRESKGKTEELYTLGVIMQEQMSLEKRLDLILTGAQTVLGFDRINILLPDHEMKMLKAVAAVGVEEPLEQIRVPLGPEGGGIAKAFLECTDIVWEGTGPVPDEWRLAHPYSEIEAFRSRAFVNVPLIVRGTVTGVLGADNKFGKKPILAETIHLLKAFAAHAAIAIDNARLYDEVKEYATELERKVEERTKALKEVQVQLIQSGKLAALGTLAAGVAHELNQPLMVIRGYAQELLADERLADPELREDLRRIEGQTTRMVAIITHLRDFSRQSKGKREPTDLNHVVTQAFTFLAQQLTTWNIGVVQELDPALPTVWADPLQIEQILLNLVTNARDALEATGSGTITIHTGRTQDGRVALTVTDTGPGIPSDLQGRIFDPFFTTKEVGKGTGLGLSICHGILEEHGGELLVHSPVADGRGARFTIVLPLSLRDSAGRVRA